MPALTTTAERIIRQPALTMPGNATGAEAACTSLTASQIRTLLSLATTSDVTFDIVRATTSVLTPLVNNASAALTLGNSTYGVTVPGNAVVTGDISMQKATQGYIRAYGTGGVNNITMYDDNTNGILSTSSGNINLVPGGGTVAVTGGITASDLVTIDGPTGASGGVTSLNITDGANATFRLSFENANRIMLSGNEGAHNLSFGGKSGNSGTSPFTERFRVDNVANKVVSYSPFICTSITASGVVSHGTYTVATLPAAGSNAGKMAQVTDSNVAASGNYGATVAAGGANRVKVFSDGTNWVIA